MSPFVFITASLLIYPILSRLLMRWTTDKANLRKLMLTSLITVSISVVSAIAFDIITINENVNWFSLTIIYLWFCLMVWRLFDSKRGLKSKIIAFSFFGLSYLIATLGCIFVLILSSEMESEQSKWVTAELIYKERNIGSGPDPSIRLKKIEIYKKINWFPLLAEKFSDICYDEWNHPLQSRLDISVSQDQKKLYMRSHVEGYRIWNWCDSIMLEKRTVANKVL